MRQQRRLRAHRRRDGGLAGLQNYGLGGAQSCMPCSRARRRLRRSQRDTLAARTSRSARSPDLAVAIGTQLDRGSFDEAFTAMTRRWRIIHDGQRRSPRTLERQMFIQADG